MEHLDMELVQLLQQLEEQNAQHLVDLSSSSDQLQLYQIMANKIPQRLFWKDLESRYVWCNQSFAEDCALDSPKSLIGLNDYDLPWARDQADFYRADDQLVMQTGEPKLNIIEPQTRSDGSHAWLHTNKVPLRNKDGDVIGMIGTYEDITARAEAEIALRRYQQMMESIFAHIPVAVFWKDQNLKYLGCNINFARDAGLSTPSEIVGKTDVDLPWTPSQTQIFQADDRQVMATGEPKLDYIEEQRQAEGNVAWLQVNKVPLRDKDSKVVGVLGTYQNVTEQIEAREALRLAKKEAYEGRQRLARELHDAVSQTLWTASLMADLLPNIWDKDRAEGEETLNRLQRLTKGALAEMRMLLLEIRPSSLVETRLNKLLERLVEATMSRKRLHIQLEAEQIQGLHPDVKIALYRIAQESLNNAARHSKAENVKIKLAEDDGIFLMISDDGRGFTRQKNGSDQLGLIIMQERAADINAEIQIESELGQGTTITVRCAKTLNRR